MAMTGPALRSAGHPRLAVTDGPAGARTVGVPARREAAWRLQVAHPEGFWCSSAAGGCGQKLILAAGQILAPYFRHASGQVRDCVSFHDEHALDRGYLHLAIQLQLHQWLSAQGYEVTLEHRFTDASRADVHVSTRPQVSAPPYGRSHDATRLDGTAHEPDVLAEAAAEGVHIRWLVRDPGAGFELDLFALDDAPQTSTQTLEVQLSSITYQALRQRDERYRQHTRQVTWLFGKQARALAGIQREERGVGYGLWPRPPAGTSTGGAGRRQAGVPIDASLSAGTEPEAGDGQVEVWIGTCHPADHTEWVPLQQCRLQADGLWTPTRDRALAEHQAAEAERLAREERDRLRRRLDAEQREREQAVIAERLRLYRQGNERHDDAVNTAAPGADAGQPHARASRHRPLPPPRLGLTEHAAGFLRLHPEAEDFTPPAGWDWLQELPPRLREPARLVAYRVSVLIASGPLSELGFLDVVDYEQLIPNALQQAGLITVGPLTWSRAFGHGSGEKTPEA